MELTGLIREGVPGGAAVLILTAVTLGLGVLPAHGSEAARATAVGDSQPDSKGKYSGATFALG